MSRKGPTSNPESANCLKLELANCLKLGALLKVKHLLLELTPQTENHVAAAAVPQDGSAMMCPQFAHKSSPSVKAMDRLVAAEVVVEEAVVEVEEKVEEDDTSKRSENWRNSRRKMKH
jgi:hypothetical protein